MASIATWKRCGPPGVAVTLDDGQYKLAEELAVALSRLPFPDPLLTFGEARQLARGTSAAHRRIQEQIDRAAK